MAMSQMAVPGEAVDLYGSFLEWLERRDVGSPTYYAGARSFLARFPDPQRWAQLPLAERLALASQYRPLLNFLMYHGHLRPGYDYLLERRLTGVLKEAASSPIGAGIATFLDAAERLGYSERARLGMASQVPVRMLIETGRRLEELSDGDAEVFETAISEREERNGRSYKH